MRVIALAHAPAQMLRWAVQSWSWARRHPRQAALIAAAALAAAAVLAAVPAAAASPGPANPDQAGDGLVDSHGVRASHYEQLFISSGDFFHPQTLWASMMLQWAWSVVYNLVVVAIGIFQWVLSFQWVNAIALPAEGVAKVVHAFVGQFQLPAFALFLCGVVAGFYVLRNKWPAALVEVGMTIALSVLAAGLFANPVLWLTQSGGPLDQAQQFGTQVSAALSGSGYLKSEAAAPDGGALNSTVTAELVDMFVATPAQVISFGHALTGDCAAAFYKAAAADDTQSSSDSNVQNAVAGCDQAAGRTAGNPQIGEFFSIAAVGGAIGDLFLFAAVFAVLGLGSVVVLLWDGIRLMISTITGMFPFSDRIKFWSSLFGVFSSLVAVVLFTGALAIYLTFICRVLQAIVKMKVPYLVVMSTITVLMFIAFILLTIQLISLRRRGKKIADLIHSKLETSKSLAPTLALPSMMSLAAVKQLLPRGRAPARPEAGPAAPGPPPVEAASPPEPPAPPAATAPAAPPPSSPVSTRPAPGRASRAGRALAGGVVTVARGAKTAGAPGAVAAAARLALDSAKRKAVARIAVDAAGRGTVRPAAPPRRPSPPPAQRPLPPGAAPRRSIVVGVDGSGRVTPASRPTFVVPRTAGPQAQP